MALHIALQAPFGPKGHGTAAATGFALGALSMAGVALALYGPAAAGPFGAYLALLAAFHQLEYICVAAYRPDTLSFDSFVINHSTAYTIAAVTSWVEYAVELWLFPFWTGWGPVSAAGLVMMLFGHGVRIAAFVTAGSNFSHIVETERRSEHQLITNGIYGILRHPAYFGFFWWSLGTQILLSNPLCTVAYAAASWRFFSDRIRFEESYLRKFFGANYAEYRERTVVGIPFIGYSRLYGDLFGPLFGKAKSVSLQGLSLSRAWVQLVSMSERPEY